MRVDRTGRLEGKVAIVTGGGRGLGRAMALALANEGATVTVAGRTRSALEEVVQRIEERGREVWAVPTDVSDEPSVNALVDSVMARYDRLDILVNRAGMILRKPTLETGAAEWKQVIDINLTGTYLCSVAAGRQMVAARSGKIVNIASVAGARGRGAWRRTARARRGS